LVLGLSLFCGILVSGSFFKQLHSSPVLSGLKALAISGSLFKQFYSLFVLSDIHALAINVSTATGCLQ
jgi:hypothetical protein